MKSQRLGIALAALNLVLLMFTVAQVRPTVAQDAAPVLRGRALEIVDTRGRVRARIDVQPAVTMPDVKSYPEAVVVRLMDPNGRIRVKLGADRDGSGLVLADDSQQPGVHMIAKGSGSFVKLTNKDGRERLLKP
ncbi:MAG: hypothetical protein HY660_00470 [Armatimonadetes bacterium]|nr:hypothetical protein [Armatimonadota bacterium]